MKFNKNKFMLLLVLVYIPLLAGCNFMPSESPQPAAPITAPVSLASLPIEIVVPEPDGSKAQTEPVHPEYILDIKGESNQLTPKALKSMTLWRENIVTLVQKHPDSIYLNGPDNKRVALTFDDGPDNINTPAIIDSLKKYNVKASFFFVGSFVKRYPEVVRYAFDNGNLVLSHSYNHDNLTQKTNNEIQADLNQTDKAIENVIEKKPALMRPPYGETDDKVEAAARETGHKIILWSIDTMDWSQRERGNIKNNVINNIRNGDIILMHSNSGKNETAKAVPMIIEELQKQNYDIVDLATLLNVQAYK